MPLRKKHAGQHRVEAGAAHHTFDLYLSRRKTMTLRVRPDGRLTVDAPTGLALNRIYAFVHSRSAWIIRHQARVSQRAVQPPRQYITGESWSYLGQPNTLRIEPGDQERVVLSGAQLIVTTPDLARVAPALQRWYLTHARQVFRQRMAALAPRVAPLGITPPESVTIRQMTSKWGSCTGKGRVTLNLKLIQLSVGLIDYVLLHELCHLRELNHSAKYYALLGAVLPDWKDYRRALNAISAAF